MRTARLTLLLVAFVLHVTAEETAPNITALAQNDGKLTACMLVVQARIKQDRERIDALEKKLGVWNADFITRITAVMAKQVILRLTNADVDRIVHRLPLKELADAYKDYTEVKYENLMSSVNMSQEEKALGSKIRQIVDDVFAKARFDVPTEECQSARQENEVRPWVESRETPKKVVILLGLLLLLVVIVVAGKPEEGAVQQKKDSNNDAKAKRE